VQDADARVVDPTDIGECVGLGAHDVDLAPAFVNAAGGDYHLTSASPLIDQGATAGIAAGESKADGNGATAATRPSAQPLLIDPGKCRHAIAVHPQAPRLRRLGG